MDKETGILKLHSETVEMAKRMFNFHPSEEFDSITHLLDISKRHSADCNLHNIQLAHLVEHMAKQLDSLKKIEESNNG